MKLSPYQISKIDTKIEINPKRIIVAIDLSEDKDMLPAEEICSNIYCVDDQYEIIWQVKELKTKVPFDDDMFVNLSKNDTGEILARRFSGFTYQIDPDTGEAVQNGFSK
jgi:hypothetical protein